MRSARLGLAVATALSVLWSGCGGSSNPSAACSPSGTWKTSGKITNTTSSLCGDLAAQLTTEDTMTITVTGVSITAHAQSGGADFTGTLDPAKCKATLNASASEPVQLTDGSTATLVATSLVNVTFNGSSLTGDQSIGVSTSTSVSGAPCTISGTISGTKQ
ncbi:hypothetical protein [Anaeromyxobacter diazotrophicus]|nr:hypothetical protein [Anaeromyxobacter diazotrophicus]